MANLYNILNDYRLWKDKIIESDGEITPELMGELDNIQSTFDEKIKAYGVVYKELQSEIAAYKAESDRLKGIADKLTNTADKLKERLSMGLRLMGQETYKSVECNLSFRKSESVDIEEDIELPQEYTKVEIKADKMLIKQALKQGKEIKGCSLKENINLQIK